MAHSNKKTIHWAIVTAEIVLFIVAIVAAYLSKTNAWIGFFSISVVSVVIFAALRIFEALPAARELATQEDFASRIAEAAGEFGVRDYFNMQVSKDQARRNEATQERIGAANQMWLCANSGASYLEPSTYRHWQFVEKRLVAGVNFRVVLLDPYSEEKKYRNLINVSGESFDSKVNIASLVKLQNAYPNLEIRFVKVGMHATVFATEGCLFFDPYHVGIVGDRIENRSFTLLVEPASPKDGVGLYQLFRSHFDSLWRSSESFADWVLRVRDKLPADLPSLSAL